jgi:hypothetical protein
MNHDPRPIPEHVRQQLNQTIDDFNRGELAGSGSHYVARYRASYLFLDRSDHGRVRPIIRLQYTGKLDAWEFALYRPSLEDYETDVSFFPGERQVDGTLQGALQAGLEAHPPLAKGEDPDASWWDRLVGGLFGRH